VGTAITKQEKEALDELFLAMKERQNFLIRLQSSRKDIIHTLKRLLNKQKSLRRY
jgi:hypothetical protein